MLLYRPSKETLGIHFLIVSLWLSKVIGVKGQAKVPPLLSMQMLWEFKEVLSVCEPTSSGDSATIESEASLGFHRSPWRAYYYWGTCMCPASSLGAACSILQHVNLILRQRLHQLVAPLERIYNKNVVNPEPLPALLRKWPRNNEMTSISEASGRSTGAVAYNRVVVSALPNIHNNDNPTSSFFPIFPGCRQ